MLDTSYFVHFQVIGRFLIIPMEFTISSQDCALIEVVCIFMIISLNYSWMGQILYALTVAEYCMKWWDVIDIDYILTLIYDFAVAQYSKEIHVYTLFVLSNPVYLFPPPMVVGFIILFMNALYIRGNPWTYFPGFSIKDISVKFTRPRLFMIWVM